MRVKVIESWTQQQSGGVRVVLCVACIITLVAVHFQSTSTTAVRLETGTSPWSAQRLLAVGIHTRGPGAGHRHRFLTITNKHATGHRGCAQLHQAQATEPIELVARQHGITVQHLLALNPQLTQQELHKGDRVCVWAALHPRTLRYAGQVAPLVMALPLLCAVIGIIGYTLARRTAQAKGTGTQQTVQVSLLSA
jgi:hypothetical protein